MMDDHRLARSDVAAHQRKALLFSGEIEQRRDHLLMAFAHEEEPLVERVFEGKTGEFEVVSVH